MKVSIIGLGWLGLELAKSLRNKNYIVIGSTTSEKKLKVINTEIQAQKLVVKENGEINYSSPDIFKSDKIIITLPYKRSFNPATIYELQLKSLLKEINIHAKQHTQIIFTSSTSIYPKNLAYVDENTPLTKLTTRQQVLLNVENLIKQNFSNTVILRLGGLFGGSRKIGMFMNKKQTLENANSPVNLIHRNDVINIIELIISNNIKSETINCVCNHHPEKKELYAFHSKKLNISAPKFIDNPIKTKYVESKNLDLLLKYNFICNNLFEDYD